ncbi:MAG: phytanoyl-CoA dioxygenase [Gemmatimonadetes bacterium]|nr:phytanoyl-CoA dioxygenase [Gemmatimonadota bacterium]|tara:strand:- start:2445 stop:3203 length:759 start_codon:yes stop_codon:yes gene_type:complete
MDMEEALASLGVHDELLTEDEKSFLDREGFLPIEKAMTADQVRALRTRFDELVKREGAAAGKEVHQEEGTHRLSNLIDKGEMFHLCISHPKVLAAMRHVLGPFFKLSSLNGRAALPGQGLQALHADWREGVAAGDYYVCNSIWLLSDFTEENGATRVVPGSNRSEKHPKDVLDDPKASHVDEILLTGPAGTAVVFNAHTWHGGTLNRTGQPRYGLHGYYTRRDQKQQLDQKASLSSATVAGLSEALRKILDV